MDRAARERLKWNCRRGMLELDLVLESFLRRHLPDLGDEQLERLAELLERADYELWDIVCGRSDRYDPRQSGIVSLLRTDWAI